MGLQNLRSWFDSTYPCQYKRHTVKGVLFIFYAMITDMNTHQLQLATAPFDAITSGVKTIESRVYDEKRQTIQLGDTIIFTNRENTDQTISVKVIGLLRYETFHDLFVHNDPAK